MTKEKLKRANELVERIKVCTYLVTAAGDIINKDGRILGEKLRPIMIADEQLKNDIRNALTNCLKRCIDEFEKL